MPTKNFTVLTSNPTHRTNFFEMAAFTGTKVSRTGLLSLKPVENNIAQGPGHSEGRVDESLGNIKGK